MSSPEHKAKPRCKVPRASQRGITLGQFRTFAKRVMVNANSHGLNWDTLNMYDVAVTFVDAVTPKHASYMEMVSDRPQVPEYFIDAPLLGCFKDVVASIEWFADARNLVDSTVIWHHMLATRQEEDMISVIASELPQIFKKCRGMCSTVSPDAEQVVRSRRLVHMHLCFHMGKPIDFCCTTGALAFGKEYQEGGWEFGKFNPKIARVLMSADWENAAGRREVEAAWTKRQIRDAPGGFAAFNARLAKAAAGPVLREAVAQNNLVEVKQICQSYGFEARSVHLTGSLGETALHIAAAYGHISCMKALLNVQADANAKDHVGETPLHYAALAGQVEAARTLVRNGAQVKIRSSFGETACDVAQQNVAGFLGVDTTAVRRVLELAATADEQPSATPSPLKWPGSFLPSWLGVCVRPPVEADEVKVVTYKSRDNLPRLRLGRTTSMCLVRTLSGRTPKCYADGTPSVHGIPSWRSSDDADADQEKRPKGISPLWNIALSGVLDLHDRPGLKRSNATVFVDPNPCNPCIA